MFLRNVGPYKGHMMSHPGIWNCSNEIKFGGECI
jgi:hypothetical protein